MSQGVGSTPPHRLNEEQTFIINSLIRINLVWNTEDGVCKTSSTSL